MLYEVITTIVWAKGSVRERNGERNFAIDELGSPDATAQSARRWSRVELRMPPGEVTLV